MACIIAAEDLLVAWRGKKDVAMLSDLAFVCPSTEQNDRLKEI